MSSWPNNAIWCHVSLVKIGSECRLILLTQWGIKWPTICWQQFILIHISLKNVPNGPVDINSLRPRQNGRHFAYNIFKCIFLNENLLILIKISLKFVLKGQLNNIPALVQIVAWRRPGDKPLSETMMVSLLTHICVTRPQWVKSQGSPFLKIFTFPNPRIPCFLSAYLE